MKRHRLDPVSFVFGLLLLSIAAVWWGLDTDTISRSDLAWATPVALIVAGTLGVLASLRR